MHCPDCGHPSHDAPCVIPVAGHPCDCANYWRDATDIPISAGRLSRGHNRRLARIQLTIPLTAAGEIDDNAFITALATLIRYHPAALDPAHLSRIMPAVIRRLQPPPPPQ